MTRFLHSLFCALTLAAALVSAQGQTLDFSTGFAGSGSLLNFNGSAQIAGTKARLTNGGINQAGTVWSKNQSNIHNFTSQFTFQITSSSGFAPGFTFAIQRAGNTALGGSGGSMGYQGINSCVALKFGTYPTTRSTTGIYAYGAGTSDQITTSFDMTSAGIDLHNGHVFSVALSYNSATFTLHQVVTDTSTNAAFTHDYTIDLIAAIGGTRAYVGFTGSTSPLPLADTQDILTWSYSAIADSYSAAFSAYPNYLQLFPRNRITNTANVQVAGSESAGGFSRAVLRVYRNGAQLGADQLQTLNYAGGAAPFSFTTPIVAELAEYDVELLFRNGAGQDFSVRRTTNIVAGDVFIIQGQSNATTIPVLGNADAYINPFVRTFDLGTADTDGMLTYQSWFVANGGGLNPPSGSLDAVGGIGQWGMVMGNLLMTANNVPIAILDGGNGGQPISFFQRNDSNPTDILTNYGRLLYRMQKGGLVGAVRSILYYQGESDNGQGAQYQAGFTALRSDWLQDYPSTEQIYVFQVRETNPMGVCGTSVARFDVDLRNRQRLFADQFPNLTVMSTTGLDGHDDCHYAFTNGYETIGLNTARVLQRDLYGGPNLPNTDPPNPVSAAVLSGANQNIIRIPLRNKADPVAFGAGAQADFAIDGAAVTVVGGTVLDGVLELQLSGNASNATAVRYTGHSGDGGRFITGKWVANASGIGLLSFIVPIVTDTTPPVITSVTPADGASSVSASTSVTAQFNEAMVPGTIGSSKYSYPNGLFTPSTDLAHTDMLRDFGAGKDQQFALTQVPNGTYDVYVWTFGDGSQKTATLSVEGNVVGTYTGGAAGRWDRLGPFRVAVTDGDIQVRVQCANGVAFVSGLEVWQGGGTLLPPPPPTQTFYRAINLGGPAITIDGNNWDANTGATSNFSTNGAAFTDAGFVFAPPQPSPNQADMLRSYRYAANLQLVLGGVANDTYNVYVWTFEDNQSLNATLSVEGTVVLPSYNTGPPGHWERLGPFPVTVNDGNLQLDYLCNTPNDLGVLSGVEVWRSSVPLAPPVGTFYRAINVGGPALIIDGNNWEGEGAPNYTVNVGSNPFTLKDALNNPVPASVSYDPVSRVATLQPATGLNGGTTYTATIKGGTAGVSDLAGNNLPSDVQWTFTTAGPPAAPIGLTVSAVFHTQIDLAWVDTSANETGFKIERKTGAGGTYAEIATVGPNVTNYSNTGLTPGTSYFYRVRATNGIGDSAYSAEANGMTTITAPSTTGDSRCGSGTVNLSASGSGGILKWYSDMALTTQVATGTSYMPSLSSTTTFYVTETSGFGGVSPPSAVTGTINALPTIMPGANPAVPRGTTSANLTYSAITGVPDKYSIDFDAAAEAQGFADVTLASLPASPIVITVPGATTPGSYNGTLTVTNSTTGCTQTSASAVTVTVTGPVPVNDNVARPSASTFIRIPTSALLGNDSRVDANGNTIGSGSGLSISAVHDAGDSTFSVTLAPPFVIYTPADRNLTTTRTFTYDVSDGTVSNTASVTVTTVDATFSLQIMSRTTAVYEGGQTSATFTFLTIPNQMLAMQYMTSSIPWTSTGALPISSGPTGWFSVTVTHPGDHVAEFNGVGGMLFQATRQWYEK